MLFLADAGVAIHAERSFANSLRADANLPADPYVGLGGMAYSSSFVTGKLSSIRVRARDLEVPGFGLVSVESGASDAEVPARTVWSGDFESTYAKKFFTNLQFDGLALGQHMGLTDLVIQNLDDVSPAGGWETEAILEATPEGYSAPVTAVVKLRIISGDVYFLPDHIISGPEDKETTKETPGKELTDELTQEFLDVFYLELPGESLPLDMPPTRIYVSGGFIFVEAEKIHATVSPRDFLPVADDKSDFEASH